MDSFSCWPLNTSCYIDKTWTRLPENPEYAERRHGDIILTLQWYHGSTCGCSFFFYLSHGMVWVCDRIHHWCSVGTEKSQPEGPPFQWETRLAQFPTERWTRGLGSFWNHWTPMIDSFSHIPILHDLTVRYSIISVGDVTEVDVYSQWRAPYISTWNSE